MMILTYPLIEKTT